MAKVIWKYPLDVMFMQEINMPQGAIPLTAQLQNDTLQLWVLVDVDTAEYEAHRYRRFAVVGTGHEMRDDPGNYIATFQVPGTAMGDLVFHVFDNGEAT